MRTIEQQKINEVQDRNFNKCVAEAQKSHKAYTMKMHEISQLHAESLLKVGSVLVYGYTSNGFVVIPSIDELANFDRFANEYFSFLRSSFIKIPSLTRSFDFFGVFVAIKL